MIAFFASTLLLGADPAETLIRRQVDALFDAFNRRDMVAMQALYAPGAVLTSSDFCAPRGRNDIPRTYQPLFEGHPDVVDTVDTVLVNGERAAVRFRATADAGEQPLRLHLVAFLRFKNGLIVEDDTVFDTGGAPMS